MSKMFDYIVGRAQSREAELEASLEHTSGYLGVEIEEGAATRAAFLAHLQEENNCRATGEHCRTWQQCGCWVEMNNAVERYRKKLAAIEQTVGKSDGN